MRAAKAAPCLGVIRACGLIVLATLLAVPLGCRDKDVVTSSFATMAEARDSGAVSRGEIPAGVPDGAQDVRIARDLDSGRHWGLFNFGERDAEALRRLLQPEEAPLDGIECDIPPRIEWWPILLRGPINAEHAKSAGLQSYRSREGSLMVVVNWKQGRAYYWKV